MINCLVPRNTKTEYSFQEIQKLNIPWTLLASYLTIDNMQKWFHVNFVFRTSLVPRNFEVFIQLERYSYIERLVYKVAGAQGSTLIIVHKLQSVWVRGCFRVCANLRAKNSAKPTSIAQNLVNLASRGRNPLAKSISTGKLYINTRLPLRR